MPNSQLFSVSNKGRIFALQTDQSVWKELPYLGIDFKRVSAHDSVVWALGGDHQVYVYVYGTSVPIRVCEEAYENQRWNPVEGFTSNLLPTDRTLFSSEDGLIDRKLENIHLPSLAWNWEDPWHLLDTFEGKALDKECWTYAVDFPRSYTGTKKWNSCVRRRKWIRYRRYIALDTWSSVSPIHKDPTEEPFIDIAVGGGEVLGQDSDELMVWGITALGKVMVHEGISASCPEGSKWTQILTPSNHDITSLAIGRSGRVWAVTWDGRALVRTGVSRDKPFGVEWFTVEPPDGEKITQVAVGVSVVWIICRDSSIWFRRGLGSSMSDAGSSWLHMFGALTVISIGPNDQVWGITIDDHCLVIRTGVTNTELTGKMWKTFNLGLLHFDPDDPQAASPINSFDEDTSSESNHKQHGIEDCCKEVSLSIKSNNSLATSNQEEETEDKPEETSKEEETLLVDDCNHLKLEDCDSINSSIKSESEANFIGQDYPIEDTMPRESHPIVDTVNNSDPSLPKTRATSISSSINSDVFLARDRVSLGQEERPFYEVVLPEENLWLWVSGGGCWILPHNLPKWFVADYTLSIVNEPWRKDILGQLLQKKEKEIQSFSSYPEAIETSSWAVNGQCRYLTKDHWVPATLELVMVGSKGCQVQEASFTIIYSAGAKKKMLIPCCSIVLCTLTVDLPAKAIVSVYTSNQPLNPVPLLFSAEKDAEEWLNHINSACIKYRGLDRSPSAYTIWGITSQGFIYVHDFSSSEREMQVETNAAHLSRNFEGNEGETPLHFDLEQNFRPGSFVTVKGTVHEDAKRFSLNLALDSSTSNLAIHFNPRFDQRVLVINSREVDFWGDEERQSIKSLSRGKDYEITIFSDDRELKISIGGKLLYRFNHRLMPGDIKQLQIEGHITVNNIVYNHGAGERSFREYFWQGVGGHLRHVESGAGGITWGISYDFNVFTFAGATGGGVYKESSNESAINLMSDVRYFYVWENQRWNPVTGFTYKGLPTDRNTWSDQSGRNVRTKEGTKLPSRHWQWISDWSIDHHAPEGVDKEGWQYATDFPMSYHAHRYVTDLVRRRRWFRKARISTSGPWKQMDKVALVSLSVSPKAASDGTIPVWGVSVSNEVVMREGVTPSNPVGTRWVLISSETKMKDICAGVECGVWAVCCNGQAHFRLGVTRSNPKGYDWVNIDAPLVPLKHIGFGSWSVFTVDRDGGLYYRVNVQSLFPEGTAWQRVCGDVDSVSVGEDGTLWAILNAYKPTESDFCGTNKGTAGHSTIGGVLARRDGVSPDCPAGTSWDVCSGAAWSHVSIRMSVPS